MIELYNYKKDCCGCTACKNVCPQGAIIMEPDEEGFLYPKLNTALCIECELCKEVCAFQKGYQLEFCWEEPLAFAVKHNSNQVRENSASGGMFTAISDYVLENNGIIYGAGFNEDFVVCHQRASTKEERDMLRGSKYVQSDLKDIFGLVKNDLLNNKIVLFTGTPCQLAGLISFLRDVDTSNLYLCDLICHGTPSPKLYADYLKFIQKLCRRPLKMVNFRDKVYGWHNKVESYTTDRGKKFFRYFLELYSRHVALRPSCHNCTYTNLNRPSDITIADFWGIENFKPEFDDDKGVSLVLINTEKGYKLFNNIQEDICCINAKIENCNQPQLFLPTPISPIRQDFWKDYNRKGFQYIIKKYTTYGFIVRNKARISKTLKQVGLLEWVKTILRVIKRKSIL